MAHKKAGGSTRNGRDSHSKRLGRQEIRRRGRARPATSWSASAARVYRPGVNVGIGTDHTLFATASGVVEFRVKGSEQRTYVNVVSK